MYEKMTQISIFGPWDNPELILDIIWQLNCIHLISIENEDLQEVHPPQFEQDEIEYRLSSIHELRAFFEDFEWLVQDVQLKDPVPYYRGEELLLTLIKEIEPLKVELNTMEKKEEVYNQYESILDHFDGLIPDLSPDSVLEVRGLIIRNPTPHIEEDLREYFNEELEDLFELELKRVKSNLVLGSLIYPKDYSSRIKKILDASKISDLELPSKIEADTLSAKIDQLLQEISAIKMRKAEILDNVKSLFGDYTRLENYEKYLVDRFAKMEGMSYLRRSNNFTIVRGFTPIKMKYHIEQLISERFSTEEVIIYYDDEVTDTPTKFKNPHGIEEFQIFTEMLPPLKVGTVDPTWLIFMFFPLFYGFIVGDIGYGIIITCLGFYVYKRYESSEADEGLKRLGWVIFLSGIVTTIFGFVFGEFFGDLGEHLGLHPLWFHRGEDLLYLLMVSIVIGVIHVCLGLILGVYNGYRIGHKKAVLRNSGFLAIYFGFGIVGMAWLYHLDNIINQMVSMVFLLIGLILVLKSEGFIGIIETLSTVGNMLSYARLMALGAASVILADLANEMYYTVGGGVVGVTIAVLLHILNIGLALFSPTIHSMRLHLVEFFNKFVEFGATEYKPFGATQHIPIS